MQKVAKVDELIDSDLQYAMTNLPDMGKAVTESRANKEFRSSVSWRGLFAYGYERCFFL